VWHTLTVAVHWKGIPNALQGHGVQLVSREKRQQKLRTLTIHDLWQNVSGARSKDLEAYFGPECSCSAGDTSTITQKVSSKNKENAIVDEHLHRKQAPLLKVAWNRRVLPKQRLHDKLTPL
jgi:PDZ domain-containing secreted protein